MPNSCVHARPLRIAVLMDVRSPWSVEIAVSLVAMGAEVTVLALRVASSGAGAGGHALFEEGCERLDRGGVTIDWLGDFSHQAINLMRMISKLRHLRNLGSKDICLCLYGGVYAIASWASGFRPYAIFWMGSDIRLVNQPIRTFSTLAAAGAALNVINGNSLSEVGRERLRMRDVLPLYHGIHCERFAVNERTFSKDRATVLCTRWFEPIYDNLTIVRAFAAVQEMVPGIRMVFAASGSQVAEAKNLWRTLRSPGLPERMSFLGGVGRSELLRELNAADIYVSMSLSDGTSTALLEALSAGLFPILSDISANREWLETHACKGILVPIGDAKALEQALVQATGDPRRRREASVHNLAVVRELADADTNLRILLAKLSAAARDNARLNHSDKG
jgi:glycosyltransferase involved in cell wall biosynthesis